MRIHHRCASRPTGSAIPSRADQSVRAEVVDDPAELEPTPGFPPRVPAAQRPYLMHRLAGGQSTPAPRPAGVLVTPGLVLPGRPGATALAPPPRAGRG